MATPSVDETMPAVSATPESVLSKLSEVAVSLENTNKRIDEVKAKADASEKELRSGVPGGAPNHRKGENTMSSRPYSYLKAFGIIAGQLQPEDARVEADMSGKLKNYHNGYNGYSKALPSSLMTPLAADFISDEKLSDEIRQTTKGTQYDPDELNYMRRKMAFAGATKALSWVDDSVGGTFVAPPLMSELIELLRNNEVLMAAGAKVMPLPPQGRLVFPRHTSAMTAYHVGESTSLTSSDIGTGDLTLSAKKLTILAKIPNELFHFSAIPIEALVREDMAKVMSLKMDKTLLEDVGSGTTPKGLINYSNILNHTSSDPGTTTDGYRFQPKDVYQMIAKVEEKNAEFNAFIMRPLLYASLVNKRADAVAAGDGQGAFLFNIFREASASNSPERLRTGNLSGYTVVKSTQQSITRDKGSATDLTYVLGGNFRDYIIAMGGAIEFALSREGDTPFTTDQTWFRGVTYYDGAPRHENSFVLCDDLIQSF